ncbi:MAG: U32 family peptidase [Nanoarchaeota archaeon]|nr:U32 family peptidase [Nanoarchaeota archaeon]
MKFSVPFNGDLELIDYIIEHKDKVSDVYFGLPFTTMPSGRLIEYNAKSDKYIDNLNKALDKLNQQNVPCTMLINLQCESEKTFSREMLDNIKKVIELYKNKIEGITLFNAVYVKQLKEIFPELSFSISVNSNINSPYKAKIAEELGFDTIVIDRDINRDFEKVKNLAESVNAKIKMLVNEACLKECLFRISHFNLLSHHKEGLDYKGLIPCVKYYTKKPWEVLLSSFILPKDLKNYDPFIDQFKIAGRNLPTKLLKYALSAYFEEKKEFDLLAVLSSYGLYVWKDNYVKKKNKIPYFNAAKLPDDFFKKITNCNFNCASCNYCEKVWNDCLTEYNALF